MLTNRNRVVSTGYSGIPRAVLQCVDGGCDICFHDLDSECSCQHAEMNAIIEGKTHKVRGAVLYINIFPCMHCAQCIVQVKIRQVVCTRVNGSEERVEKYLEDAGVEVKYLSIVV